MSLNTDIFYQHLSATINRVWLYYQHPIKTTPCRNRATTSQTTPIILAVIFQYNLTPTTSQVSTNPWSIQYHCTTHISLMHITNFTYAKYNHAQIYATTASCYSLCCQLLVPVPPEYWIFKMASLCCFSILSHNLARFAVPRCYSDRISNFLIFPLPADHSWQQNRGQKTWRGLKTNKKGSAYFQEKGWYLWQMWVF